MKPTPRDASPSVWRRIWEDALFGDNPRLHAFARSSAATHKILAIQEAQGTVTAEVRPPSGRRVTVTLALPRLSLERRLEPWPGWDLPAGSTDWLEALAQKGLPLWPQGMQEVQASVTPATGQNPCPCTLTALWETGWLLELDPGLLLRMRGLTPESLQLSLDRQPDAREAGVQRDPSGKQADDPTAAEDTRRDRFWGNPRALRTYTPSHDPATASFMPVATMGAPPVENEEGQRLLSRLLQDLYAQGSQDAHES